MPEDSAQHKEKKGEEGGALQKECKIRAKTQTPQSRGQSQLDKNLAMGGGLKSAGVGKGCSGVVGGPACSAHLLLTGLVQQDKRAGAHGTF